jgi:hypothetical protein
MDELDLPDEEQLFHKMVIFFPDMMDGKRGWDRHKH